MDKAITVEAKEVPQVQVAIPKGAADIDGFIARRQEFIQKVSAICVEGKDYHIIQGKKSLAKGGAEKIASIFQWSAVFSKDTESIEMLGSITGLVAFKCTLSKGSKFVGEGRGAATLQKNSSDPNKTLKMAQKSAYVDAVIRTSGLSDFFTQDLEDMDASEIGHTSPETVAKTIPVSPRQLELIASLMKQKGYMKADLHDMGFNSLTGGKEGTASELIDTLLKAKSKINPNGAEVIDLDSPEVPIGS